MPFCTECGARLEEGAKFCTECGARQPELTPSAPVSEQQPSYSAQQPTQGSPRPSSYDPSIYSAPVPEKTKKGGGKIVFIILAVLAVLAAVFYVISGKLGGSEKADDALLGVYQATRAELGSIEMNISDMWEKGFSIELKDKGRCEVNVDGNKGSAKWELDGEDITIKGSGLDCSGTLSNGILVLEDVMGTGVKLSFTKEGVVLPVQTPVETTAPAPAQTPEPAPASGEEALLGTYYAVKGEAFGVEVPIESMWEKGFSIELQQAGRASVQVNEASADASWSVEADRITVSIPGLELSGTIEDDDLIIEDVYGTGVTLYFSKNPSQLAVSEPSPTAEPQAVTGDYSSWSGDYYGWWVAYDAGGTYDEYVSHAWDVCGTITVNGDSGRITLWDEDMDVDTISETDVRFAEGLTDKGSMTNVNGNFFNYKLDEGDWIVDPGDSACGGFDDLIAIHGTYYASTGSQDWIEYYIFLRPWGMRWDDIAGGDTSGMIYPGDMLPVNYYDWYLPLIEAGQGMPAGFEGLDS